MFGAGVSRSSEVCVLGTCMKSTDGWSFITQWPSVFPGLAWAGSGSLAGRWAGRGAGDGQCHVGPLGSWGWAVRGTSVRGKLSPSSWDLPWAQPWCAGSGCLSLLQNERAYLKNSTEVKPGNSINSTGQKAFVGERSSWIRSPQKECHPREHRVLPRLSCTALKQISLTEIAMKWKQTPRKYSRSQRMNLLPRKGS